MKNLQTGAVVFSTIILTGVFLKLGGDGKLGSAVQKLCKTVTEGFADY